MHMQVHYQGINHTPWVDQFVSERISKIDKYLNPSAKIQVNLKYENRAYVTAIAIHNMNHDYAFTTYADNLFEAFSTAVDKASRKLSEHKNKIKDRINRRYTSVRELSAEY